MSLSPTRDFDAENDVCVGLGVFYCDHYKAISNARNTQIH